MFNNEVAAREAADAQLSTDLLAETVQRAAVDSELEVSIAAEETRATAAELVIETLVTQETANRVTADDSIVTFIEDEVESINDTITTMDTTLTGISAIPGWRATINSFSGSEHTAIRGCSTGDYILIYVDGINYTFFCWEATQANASTDEWYTSDGTSLQDFF